MLAHRLGTDTQTKPRPRVGRLSFHKLFVERLGRGPVLRLIRRICGGNQFFGRLLRKPQGHE